MRFGVTVDTVILSDTAVRLIISRLVSVSGLVTGTGLAAEAQMDKTIMCYYVLMMMDINSTGANLSNLTKGGYPTKDTVLSIEN
nr:hypothetical protein CFP56_33254 [Quercus suber]